MLWFTTTYYITVLDIQGTPFNLALPDLDIPANPHSAPGRHHALRERAKTVYIGEFFLWNLTCSKHWYRVYMDSSSHEITGHHCNWFSAYRNRKTVQNALHSIYKNHLCWLHYAMHYAKPRPFCKHQKQFSAYDKPFDWLEIVSWYNWPMVQTFTCSSLSPVMTTCYDQERCVSQIHVNTCQRFKTFLLV